MQAPGGIGVYRPTTGEATSFELRNTIVANNGIGRQCFYRNAVSPQGSGNLVVNGIPPGSSRARHRADRRSAAAAAADHGAPGWTPTMAIPLTSPAVDTADPDFAEQLDQRTALRPFGAGYDIGAFEAANRPPVTGITLDPASPNGSNGWYTTPTVGVTVSASDPDGTVAETRCVLDPLTAPAVFAELPPSCGVTSIATDGQHSVYAGSSDNNGATESPLARVDVNIDSVAPTLNPTLSVANPTLGQTGLTAFPNASDATSGIATDSCGTVDTSTPGDHTVSCSANDRAGLTRQATIHHLVGYRILRFFSPSPSPGGGC